MGEPAPKLAKLSIPWELQVFTSEQSPTVCTSRESALLCTPERSPSEDLPENSTVVALPPELLLHIMSYLPKRDLLYTIPDVCEQWRELARHPVLWNKFVYSPVRRTPLSEIISFIKKCPMLKHLCVFRRHNGLDELFEAVLESCSDLQTFCLDSNAKFFTVDKIDTLFNTFPNLTSFGAVINPTCPKSLVQRISMNSKLKKLTLKCELYSTCSSMFSPIVDGCVALEHLCIEDACLSECDQVYILQNMRDKLSYVKFSSPLTQEGLCLLCSFTKLQNLTLSHKPGIGYLNYLPLAKIRCLKCFTFTSHSSKIPDFESIFDVLFQKPFPQLQKLKLRILIVKIDRILLEGICCAYPYLDSLYLQYKIAWEERDSFKNLVELQQLERLTYGRSRSIVDEDVKFISQCPKLRHLSLFECKEITDSSVAYLQQCKSLESLNLNYCSLTGRSLRLIVECFEQLRVLEVLGIRATQNDLSTLAERMPFLQIRY